MTLFARRKELEQEKAELVHRSWAYDGRIAHAKTKEARAELQRQRQADNDRFEEIRAELKSIAERWGTEP